MQKEFCFPFSLGLQTAELTVQTKKKNKPISKQRPCPENLSPISRSIKNASLKRKVENGNSKGSFRAKAVANALTAKKKGNEPQIIEKPYISVLRCCISYFSKDMVDTFLKGTRILPMQGV